MYTSVIKAAVLIVGREIFRKAGIAQPWASTEDICEKVGCSRSQAYESVARLREALANLNRSAGRPRSPDLSPEQLTALVGRVRDFVMDNPGCVQGAGQRRVYTDAFRRFVVSLKTSDRSTADLTVEQLASVANVPVGTLKDWLRAPASLSSETDEDASTDKPAPGVPHLQIADPRIGVIFTEYLHWFGTLRAFVRHLHKDHHLLYKRTFVASILEAAGLRTPNRRKKRRNEWSRRSFRMLFPGFQWLGDGKTIAAKCNDTWYTFNVEAIVDAASNGVLGFELTDTEDEAAVLEAYDAAMMATPQSPLAVTLDNRPSNHTQRVIDTVAPAALLRSFPGRGESKAPVEGTFGLFSQTAPPLHLKGSSPRELARSFAQTVLWTWAWARNHKPRRKLGGKTPVEAYLSSKPTPDQLAEAKRWILELRRREELAQRTRRERADPVRLQLLRENLLALGIDDPEDRLATYLAAHSKSAILESLATFRAKLKLGTVPQNADHGRYLAGIIRNLNARDEDRLVAKYLLELRLRDRELSLRPLQRQAERLRATVAHSGLPERLVEYAIAAEPKVDFRFWATKVYEALFACESDLKSGIYRRLTAKVAVSFHLPLDRRRELISMLSDSLSPG